MSTSDSDLSLTTATILRRAYGEGSMAEALARWQEAIAEGDPSVVAIWRRVWLLLENRPARVQPHVVSSPA